MMHGPLNVKFAVWAYRRW